MNFVSFWSRLLSSAFSCQCQLFDCIFQLTQFLFYVVWIMFIGPHYIFIPDLLIQFCVVYVTLPIDSVKAGKTWVCIYSAFFWQRCAVQAAARLCRRWPGSVWLGTVVGGKASRSVWLRRGLLWLFFLLSFLLVCHRLQGLTDQRELLFRIND